METREVVTTVEVWDGLTGQWFTHDEVKDEAAGRSWIDYHGFERARVVTTETLEIVNQGD